MLNRLPGMPVRRRLCPCLALSLFMIVAPLYDAFPARSLFNYSDCLFGRPKTLSIGTVEIDRASGTVECRGGDSARPQQPFTWDWGDGQRNRGFFPQRHSYRDRRRNYLISVTAHYPGGITDTVQAPMRFIQVSLPSDRPRLPNHVSVRVPSEKPVLHAVRAPYRVSPNLAAFDDSFFQTCSRDTVEYVLTQAAAVQMELANDNVCTVDGKFEQVLLWNPTFGGMHSIWFTDPVAFGVGDYGFTGNIQWSSFFHEMGHNVTLNSPAEFHWGFKQDGRANCIYSETMAQIFQHATAYELVNNPQTYGISRELAFDIAQSAYDSMYRLRRGYEDYLKNGRQFRSWKSAETEHDDTRETFKTIAYTFVKHAEAEGHGYRQPVKRLMEFLQRFNPDWEKGFSARKNSPEAEQFRATLMTAALSHAFQKDLRSEFRHLRFPIDDKVFQELKTSGGL